MARGATSSGRQPDGITDGKRCQAAPKFVGHYPAEVAELNKPHIVRLRDLVRGGQEGIGRDEVRIDDRDLVAVLARQARAQTTR